MCGIYEYDVETALCAVSIYIKNHQKKTAQSAVSTNNHFSD